MGMKHSLTFGGVNSADYGIWITGAGTFAAPERDVELVPVPGRNGELIIDNGRWRNIDITYPANIPTDFDAKISAFRAEICRRRGYQRLEDDYHLDEFRLAAFVMGLQPEPTPLNRGGEFDMVFNCKPQRFLKSGEVPTQVIPAAIVGTSMRSGYIPISGTEATYKIHCAENDTIFFTIDTYDDNGDSVATWVLSGTDGQVITDTFPEITTDKYWRVTITGYTNADDTSFEFWYLSEYNGKPFEMHATICTQYTVINPTGYASKPLIEVYGITLPYVTWDNYTNGEISYYYVFSSTAAAVDHFYMDCELQYLYDDDKNNLTSKLSLTTSGSDIGTGSVFPEFSAEKSVLSMSYSAPAIDDGLCLLNIYPRWWRL